MPLGPHSIAMWIVDTQEQTLGMGENLKVLCEPIASHFTVVSVKKWQAWLAAGAEAAGDPAVEAAIAEEKQMIGPNLLEWHQQHMREHSPKPPAPWACPHVHSATLIVGIKTHARGFRARDALRRTWLTQLGVAPLTSACAWYVQIKHTLLCCLLNVLVLPVNIIYIQQVIKL